MCCAEERAEKTLKSASTRKTTRWVSSVFCPSSPRFTPPSHRASPGFRSWLGQRQYFCSRSAADRPSRPGNCFACGRFGHWRPDATRSLLLDIEVILVVDEELIRWRANIDYLTLCVIWTIFYVKAFPKTMSLNCQVLVVTMTDDTQVSVQGKLKSRGLFLRLLRVNIRSS